MAGANGIVLPTLGDSPFLGAFFAADWPNIHTFWDCFLEVFWC
jgi:hypothetical protein